MMRFQFHKVNFSRISLLFPNDTGMAWALNTVVQQAKPNGENVLEEQQNGSRATQIHSNKHDQDRILIHQVKAANPLSP